VNHCACSMGNASRFRPFRCGVRIAALVSGWVSGWSLAGLWLALGCAIWSSWSSLAHSPCGYPWGPPGENLWGLNHNLWTTYSGVTTRCRGTVIGGESSRKALSQVRRVGDKSAGHGLEPRSNQAPEPRLRDPNCGAIPCGSRCPEGSTARNSPAPAIPGPDCTTYPEYGPVPGLTFGPRTLNGARTFALIEGNPALDHARLTAPSQTIQHQQVRANAGSGQT